MAYLYFYKVIKEVYETSGFVSLRKQTKTLLIMVLGEKERGGKNLDGVSPRNLHMIRKGSYVNQKS